MTKKKKQNSQVKANNTKRKYGHITRTYRQNNQSNKQTTSQKSQGLQNTTAANTNTNIKPTTKKSSKGSLVKSSLWGFVPGAVTSSLDELNSTSPIHNKVLPYEPLWDTVKDQGGFSGNTLEAVDAIFSPTNSKVWEGVKDTFGDLTYSVWSKGADLFSDDADFINKVGTTGRDIVRNIITGQQYITDYGGYLVPGYNLGKFGRDIGKSVLNNIWDFARDYETIKDYSYDNLGFDDYIGDSIVNAASSGLNSMFSRFGEDREFYQRGRYSLNEMLTKMSQDIANTEDKTTPEFKQLVDKFEQFNNLATLSDSYWQLTKELENSGLNEEEFFRSRNITPQQFEYLKQNANTVHNLGNNLELNESNGNKRSDYVEGNYSYQDFTKAVNEAKKSLEEGTPDIDTDTLNAAINMSTDVGKVIAGDHNTSNENTQSSLTPDYLTEFYKKFDKKYNYDPAKGRFNIWL